MEYLPAVICGVWAMLGFGFFVGIGTMIPSFSEPDPTWRMTAAFLLLLLVCAVFWPLLLMVMLGRAYVLVSRHVPTSDLGCSETRALDYARVREEPEHEPEQHPRD